MFATYFGQSQFKPHLVFAYINMLGISACLVYSHSLDFLSFCDVDFF